VKDSAYLNGKYMPLDRARVPVADRGFLFGDGIYEVIRATDGRPFLLAEHLRRLRNSARMIELRLPPEALFRRVIARLLRRFRLPEAEIYIQVTRGVHHPRTHAYPPRGTPPTVLLAAWKLRPRPEELFVRGAAAITVEDFRWGRCDVKSVNLLPNCMAKEAASRRGASEAIFVKRGFLVEGGSSSVFVVRRGRLLVPGLGPELLPSLTRELVFRMARRMGIPFSVRPVPVREMFAAAEVFLASTTAEGLGIVRIDGRRIGDGRPGPVTMRIHAAIGGLRRSGGRR
jgi:D-alanine transaminase